jgi:hypothetical protein
MLDLSEVREDYEATGTEEQDKGDAQAPSNPLARHAVEHHDSTSPAYTVRRPLVLASDVAQKSFQPMPCRHHIIKVPNIAITSIRWLDSWV